MQLLARYRVMIPPTIGVYVPRGSIYLRIQIDRVERDLEEYIHTCIHSDGSLVYIQRIHTILLVVV